MTKPSEPTSKPLQGIAALFDDFERKELFKKYLFFLGWVEILILAICWFYQLGDRGYDSYGGPIDIPFPWGAYFLIAFLTPVAITFLLGVIVVGFNKYFAEPEAAKALDTAEEEAALPEGATGKLLKLIRMVKWVQQMPFLALLLLLAIGVAFFYKLEALLGFFASVGEKSVKILLISAGILLLLASIFALILIVLNYQLRKRSMAYQYKSEMAERFGLIILEDNTVLNSEGKLLVSGKSWKDAVPLLPVESSETERPAPEESESTATTLNARVDFKTT